MNISDITIIFSVSLIFILFPLLVAGIAFSRKRKDWGIVIIITIFVGFGWLLSLLFLRELSKTDETIQQVFSFIVGILILSASLASLFLGWSKIVRIAEFVGKDVGVIIGPIPMSGSLFLLLIIFIAFFLAIAWGFSLVYFGITGRRVR